MPDNQDLSQSNSQSNNSQANNQAQESARPKPLSFFILTSHPIQYQAPLFRKLAGIIPEFKVFFLSDKGYKEHKDPEFQVKFSWDIPLIEGYKSQFLEKEKDILKELNQNKPDYFLVYGWNKPIYHKTISTAKKLGIKTFLIGENPLNQELFKPFWKRMLKKIILGKMLFGKVGAFLYIGEENKKFYQYYGVPDSKLFFTPYAVDNERFQKAAAELIPQRDELRAKFGIAPEDIVILFAGKLIPKKRPMDLLKTYIGLRSRFLIHETHSTKLIFVGDGPLRKPMENYLKELKIPDVIFTGFKNQTEIPEFYALADIFVLPSGLGETWGLVINEAMNFGLPIITTTVVGAGPDLVKENENGSIVPLGDLNIFADDLYALIKDQDLRKKFGRRSREIVLNYSYENDSKGLKQAMNANLPERFKPKPKPQTENTSNQSQFQT